MNIYLEQGLLTTVISAVVGLLVVESYQTTSWLADKLMRWSVRLRYTGNPERATIRGEELLSLLEDLPTLLKLPTAVGFLLYALAYRLADHRSDGSRFTFAVKRDVVLFLTLYLVNLFCFAPWLKLMTQVEIKPWLLLVWLYGIVMFVPLVWRNRAPVAVFAIEWVLTVAGWPIMPWYIPVVGVPVALYAVTVHRSAKISVLALLASFIPIGLGVGVIFATSGDPFYSFIANAILLSWVTVGVWAVGCMTQASQQNPQHQTKPRAGQPSFEARYRVKRDVLLFALLYLVNFFWLAPWLKLMTQMEIKPWLLLVWLYGIVMFVPLVWRNRAPIAVFAIEWVLTVAGWPIMPWYIPVVGVPVALYAVTVHRSAKISVLALLASFIPIGLDAGVIPTIHGDPLANAIFLSLVTVGVWAVGCMTQASQQNPQHQTKPRAGQPSFEARSS